MRRGVRQTAIEMNSTGTFREYERHVIAELCRGALTARDLEEVLDGATYVDFWHTGVGYFLTVRHDLVPVERAVCSTPLLAGRAPDVDVGFVVFLENRELTLECHGWGEAIPTDIRERALVVGPATVNNGSE
jgi:hypothetical protein